MTNKPADWNWIDRLLSSWRYRFVKQYIDYTDDVLDVGCGQKGLFLQSIKEKIRSGDGYDFKLRKEQEIDNISLKKGAFQDSDNTYDVVLLMAVIEHVYEPKKLLEDIYEKMRDSGTLILTTPDKRSQWLLELLAYKLHIINEAEIRDHKHYFDKQELIALANEVGFSSVKHKHFQLGMNNLLVCTK